MSAWLRQTSTGFGASGKRLDYPSSLSALLRSSRQNHAARKLPSCASSRTLETGTSCPIAYRYTPRQIADSSDEKADVLYVIGGLYGNIFALEAIEQRAEAERSRPTCVFNGDFNFFNKSLDDFLAINSAVLKRHVATAGNVEYEISSDHAGSQGCGCGYPSYASSGTIDRSDKIVAELGATAVKAPSQLLSSLRQLPKFRTFQVGGVRLAAIHGDAHNLAGWSFGIERMEPADETLRASLGCADNAPLTRAASVGAWLAAARVGMFACAHTCLPFAQRFALPAAGEFGGGASAAIGAVFNSGAAGLPCFANTAHGLMTRVAADLRPPADSLYGCELMGANGCGRARVDCVPVRYDAAAFRAWFEREWPAGSAAHVGYHGRICRGPAGFTVAQADRLHVRVCEAV